MVKLKGIFKIRDVIIIQGFLYLPKFWELKKNKKKCDTKVSELKSIVLIYKYII